MMLLRLAILLGILPSLARAECRVSPPLAKLLREAGLDPERPCPTQDRYDDNYRHCGKAAESLQKAWTKWQEAQRESCRAGEALAALAPGSCTQSACAGDAAATARAAREANARELAAAEAVQPILERLRNFSLSLGDGGAGVVDAIAAAATANPNGNHEQTRFLKSRNNREALGKLEGQETDVQQPRRVLALLRNGQGNVSDLTGIKSSLVREPLSLAFVARQAGGLVSARTAELRSNDPRLQNLARTNEARQSGITGLGSIPSLPSIPAAGAQAETPLPWQPGATEPAPSGNRPQASAESSSLEPTTARAGDARDETAPLPSPRFEGHATLTAAPGSSGTADLTGASRKQARARSSAVAVAKDPAVTATPPASAADADADPETKSPQKKDAASQAANEPSRAPEGDGGRPTVPFAAAEPPKPKTPVPFDVSAMESLDKVWGGSDEPGAGGRGPASANEDPDKTLFARVHETYVRRALQGALQNPRHKL